MAQDEEPGGTGRWSAKRKRKRIGA